MNDETRDSAESSWESVPELVRSVSSVTRLPAPWDALFGPLRAGNVDNLLVFGQIGQSLDGKVATNSGHSHYINGRSGLEHLHRLRAIADAVVIGVGTALADDPQLTVRRVSGPHPARVVIDPRGRISASARMFAADGVRRMVMSTDAAQPKFPAEIYLGATAPGIAQAGLGIDLVLRVAGFQTPHFPLLWRQSGLA